MDQKIFDVFQSRIDIPTKSFYQGVLTSTAEEYLDTALHKAFDIARLAPSHGNTNPVKMVYLESSSKVISLYEWLDQHYAVQPRYVKLFGACARRMVIPIYRVHDRGNENNSHPEWESMATCAIATNWFNMILSSMEGLNVQDAGLMHPGMHWTSSESLLEKLIQYLQEIKVLEPLIYYKTVGMIHIGLVTDEVRKSRLNHPHHTEKLNTQNFVL